MHYKVNLRIDIVFNRCSQNKISSYLKYHKIADDRTKKTRINELAVLSSPVQLWFIMHACLNTNSNHLCSAVGSLGSVTACLVLLTLRGGSAAFVVRMVVFYNPFVTCGVLNSVG